MDGFREEPKGVLVSMDADETSGLSYTVWFPYTRKYIRDVREGDLVAVRSFASDGKIEVFSVLEIVSALPFHYALGTSSTDAEKAFPGFYLEAAKSARVDWEQEEPTEQTTKIRTEAIPTGIQLTYNSNRDFDTSPDVSLPMVGEEALLLSDELTNLIINKGLLDSGIKAISPGNLVLNPEVSVVLSLEDLLRTHFGVFGFTGAGKSNLLSTMVAEVLSRENETKVVLVDLMSEYTSLLIDLVDALPESYILSLDADSLPGGDITSSYLLGDSSKEKDAVEAIVRTLLLPRDLSLYRQKFSDTVKRVLRARKLRVFDPGAEEINSEDLSEAVKAKIDRRAGSAAKLIETWVDVRISGKNAITRKGIEKLVSELEGFLKNGIPIDFGGDVDFDSGAQSTLIDGGVPTQGSRKGGQEMSPTAQIMLNSIRAYLRKMLGSEMRSFPENARLSLGKLRELLNKPEGHGLVIVQCNRNDELRTSTAMIIESIYNYRRRLGKISPPVLFAFDEADEFIPQIGSNNGSSYQSSRSAITTLARRGRKFGLGMAIATQRVTYLDTSILAQPHTYFVSKLPRKTDRERMSEAFGLMEDMMRKTLKFTKGQWLLVSFDATGLVNVPIPIQLRNANDRVLNYISQIRG